MSHSAAENCSKEARREFNGISGGQKQPKKCLKKNKNHRISCREGLLKPDLTHHYIPSCETFFQGWGGYIKAAFWIWSLMSSSSLKGNVPLRLTTRNTNHFKTTLMIRKHIIMSELRRNFCWPKVVESLTSRRWWLQPTTCPENGYNLCSSGPLEPDTPAFRPQSVWTTSHRWFEQTRNHKASPAAEPQRDHTSDAFHLQLS